MAGTKRRWFHRLEAFDLASFVLIVVSVAYLTWQFWIRKS
jgi:hypothetical protein